MTPEMKHVGSVSREGCSDRFRCRMQEKTRPRDGKRFPSDLAKSGAIKRTSDGFDYLDPEQFREYFAADRSEKEAAFAAHSQLRIP
jgi:hypothetical protein